MRDDCCLFDNNLWALQRASCSLHRLSFMVTKNVYNKLLTTLTSSLQ